jgi:hypothetical protein
MKQIYHVQFTNGTERRSTTVLQPDIIFAAMEAQAVGASSVQDAMEFGF